MRKLFRILVWITVVCFSLILGFIAGQATLPPADRETVQAAIKQTVEAWPSPTALPTYTPIVVKTPPVVVTTTPLPVTSTPVPSPTIDPTKAAATATRRAEIAAALTATVSANTDDLITYQIVETKDISLGATKRMSYTVLVSDMPSPDELIKLAQIIVEAKHSKDNPVNAVNIFVYQHFARTTGIVDATVIWAPNGVWADADNVRTGDYSTHQYSVDYYDPRPTPSGDEDENRRRTIFGEALKAQAGANALTEEKRLAGDFKDLDEEIEFSQAALRAANDIVIQRFDLTRDQFFKIMAEGIEKKW